MNQSHSMIANTISAAIRICLLASAIGTALYLAVNTLGVTLWLALVLGLAIPVIATWLTLCNTLKAHEPAIDAMLQERRDTLLGSVQAAQNSMAYTSKKEREAH